MIPKLSYFVMFCAASFFRALSGHWQRASWRAQGVRVARGVVIRSHSDDALQIAPGTAIGLGTLLIATNEMNAQPAQKSCLRIGAGTAINEFCNIRASGGEITIGAKCLIAQMVSIIASNHSVRLGKPMIDQLWSTSPQSVSIGDDVWLGAGSTVLPGARIGSGAVIAAGAVVRGVVPEREIWGGVPARFLKARIDE